MIEYKRDDKKSLVVLNRLKKKEIGFGMDLE
jgi:hypothetical protein